MSKSRDVVTLEIASRALEVPICQLHVSSFVLYCLHSRAGGSHFTSSLQLIHFGTKSSIVLDNFIERFAELALHFFYAAGSLCTGFKICKWKLRSGAVAFLNALSGT